MKLERFFFLIILAAMVCVLSVGACAGDDDDDAGDDDDDDNDGDGDDDDDRGVAGGYPLVDTDQSECYDDKNVISCTSSGTDFFGQDAFYNGTQPVYQDNGDGTVTDQVTGLMWQQDPGDKTSYDEAASGADSFELAGHSDWRLPTIKELYSLILFSGTDVSGESGNAVPFIDDNIFAFNYGDESAGERIIDSQWVTSSIYGGSVMNGSECFFGVNFADGRIKCYPTSSGAPGGYFTIHVRDTDAYGLNDFQDNDNDTIDDRATDLMWQQGDSGQGMVWGDALSYCESLTLAGHDDWRLPNAKELQSIVNYNRSPDQTGSPAIDPVFDVTLIENEAGQDDYPFFWTSTTHVKSNGMGDNASYIAFGRALGYFSGQWQDVHGAGAQRSDPKIGNPDDYPEGHGPQGDAIRIYNYARCVKGAE